LLFFFTDGCPGFQANGQSTVHSRFISTVAQIAVRNGIEIYPIGLGYDIAHHFKDIKVPMSAVINNIDALLPVLDGWVVKALRDMANASIQHRMV